MHSCACLTLTMLLLFITVTVEAENGILASSVDMRHPCLHKRNKNSIRCKERCPSGWTGEGCLFPICPGGCGESGECINPGYCRCDGFYSFLGCTDKPTVAEVLHENYFYIGLIGSVAVSSFFFIIVVVLYCQTRSVAPSDVSKPVIQEV
uniref:TIL domain-containing protein n=2 Tax=Bursaphelenchus xylophilus TaxID=6326 RepID=A0A1I7RQ66_BURXY